MKNKIPILSILLLILFISFLSAAPKDQKVFEESVSIAKSFLNQLAKLQFNEAARHFDDTMTDLMPPSKLEELWNQIQSQVGSYKRYSDIQTQLTPEYDVILIRCEFEKAELETKIVIDRKKKIAGLFFRPAPSKIEYMPPSYCEENLFDEKEIYIGSKEWKLPGTLTTPKGQGLYPAVVLVHGSGPNDRDESIGPNKPFRDFACGLASRNIAVIRYDKRTKVHGKKMASVKGQDTVKEETIDDVLLAVKLLRNEDRIDKNKIFVLGHSLGGMLIPRIATRDEKIAGFIILAAPTRPLEDLMVEQIDYIYSLKPELTEDDKKYIKKVHQEVQRIKKLEPKNKKDLKKIILGAPATYWLDLAGYQPAESAKTIMKPLLICQGGRDYQVTDADFEGWKTALSGKENVSLKLYPELNHLFMEGKGKSSPAEYQAFGHVSSRIVKDIADWIHNQN